MCSRNEKKKKTLQRKTRNNTNKRRKALCLNKGGSGGGDPELCLRGRWVVDRACGRRVGKKDSYDKLR